MSCERDASCEVAKFTYDQPGLDKVIAPGTQIKGIEMVEVTATRFIRIQGFVFLKPSNGALRRTRTDDVWPIMCKLQPF